LGRKKERMKEMNKEGKKEMMNIGRNNIRREVTLLFL